MTNKRMKGCSALLVIGELQIESMRYCYKHIRLKRNLKNKISARMQSRTLNVSLLGQGAPGDENGVITLKDSLIASYKC